MEPFATIWSILGLRISQADTRDLVFLWQCFTIYAFVWGLLLWPSRWKGRGR